MAVGSPAQTPLKTPLKIAGLFGHLKYKPASPSANSVDVVATDIAAAAAGNGGQRQATSTSPSTADPKMATERSPFFASTLSPGAVKVEGDDDGHASEPSPLQSSHLSPTAGAASSASKKRKASMLSVAKEDDEDEDRSGSGGGGGFILPDLELAPVPPKKVFAKFRPFASPEKYQHLGGITDHLSWENDVVLCGINPGVSSAAKGHHYAGPTNRFWPCLHQSGLVPDVVTYKDDARLPADYNLGLTNLVSRPTTAASELSAAHDMRPGVPVLLAKILRYRPQIVCFVGKDIWREVQFVLAAAERRKAGGKKGPQAAAAGWDAPRPWKVVHPSDGKGRVRQTYFWAVSSTSGLCRDTMDQRRAAWGRLNDFKLEILRRRAADPDSLTASPIAGSNLDSFAVVDVEAVEEWTAEWQGKLARKAAADGSGSEKAATQR